MKVSISKKDKMTVSILAMVAIVSGAMYAGERYRPFGVAQTAASCAVAKIHDRQPVGAKPTYTVHRGDTIYGIAKKFGTHPELIKFENNIGEDAVIHPGDKLVIPHKRKT